MSLNHICHITTDQLVTTMHTTSLASHITMASSLSLRDVILTMRQHDIHMLPLFHCIYLPPNISPSRSASQHHPQLLNTILATITITITYVPLPQKMWAMFGTASTSHSLWASLIRTYHHVVSQTQGIKTIKAPAISSPEHKHLHTQVRPSSPLKQNMILTPSLPLLLMSTISCALHSATPLNIECWGHFSSIYHSWHWTSKTFPWHLPLFHLFH